MSVVIETTAGDFTIDLYTEERPRACLNFLKLCKIKYYNFCLFHTIERNFSAQTGDPTGTGRGGESIFSKLYGDQAKFFEAETKPRLKHVEVGTVSMVNNGENMHGSQFFITLGEQLDFLDGTHTVFGQVGEGLDTLMKINDTICDSENKPYQDIRVTHTVILDDPYDDPPGLVVPDRSPEPSKEHLQSNRIGVHEEIDDTKGKSLDEITEEIQNKEAKARATILEMVGDIPDADVKPPDNVLFVCKLNPVTTAEDLEVIFSRFGTILGCEVIKDRKTGESLQYAFIEFENPDECENAYFKMDNVLIDDRRIHVDFSQSVAKLNWQEMRKNAQTSFKKPQFKIKNTKLLQTKDPKYDLVFEDVKTTSTRKHESERSKERDTHVREKASPPRSRSKHEQPDRSRSSSQKYSSSKSSSLSKRHQSRSRSRDRHRTSRHHDKNDSRKRRDDRRSSSQNKKSKKHHHHRHRSPSPGQGNKRHKHEHKKHKR